MKAKIEQRTERRISAAFRITLCIVIVALQIAVSLFLSIYLQEKAAYIYGALELAGAVLAVRVYTRNGSPSYKLIWMCLLLAVPVAGMILFWLWGGTHQAKSLSLKRVLPPARGEGLARESMENLAELRERLPEWERLAAYLEKREFTLFRGSEIQYIGDGTEFFDDLAQHLQRAEQYIFMEYYILAEGTVWNRLFKILRERAAAGVEVRLIFDDFGNITRLSEKTLQSIQDAGIEVEVFNPVHRYINRLYFNYRDHRKITVIDGKYAYTGGINIADEYANIIRRFGHWKDSGVRIDGEGVWGFTAQFIQMWKMLGGHLAHPDEKYRSDWSVEGHGFCQPLTDGPENNPDAPIEDTYLQMIATAKRELFITTPYYAVEESMQRALCIAADAGVDVRLMVPSIPDHKLVYLVAETYWGELMSHGVKIYQYTPGFIHAKSVMADGEVGLVGTTNMDYRTFALQYECAVLMYQMDAVGTLRQDLLRTMEESRRYTMEEWNARPWYRKAFATLLKVFDIWF